MKKIIFLLFVIISFVVITLQMYKNIDIIKSNNLVSQFFKTEDKVETEQKDYSVKKTQKSTIDSKYQDAVNILGVNEVCKLSEKCETFGYELTVDSYRISNINEGFTVKYPQFYKFDENNNLIDDNMFLIIDLTIKNKNNDNGNIEFCVGNFRFCSVDKNNKIINIEEVNGSDKLDNSKSSFIEDISVGQTIKRKISFVISKEEQESIYKYLVFCSGGGNDISGQSPVELYDISN